MNIFGYLDRLLKKWEGTKRPKITEASIVYIAGEPVAGKNATITKSYGIWRVTPEMQEEARRIREQDIKDLNEYLAKNRPPNAPHK